MTPRRDALGTLVAGLDRELRHANTAREAALPACRASIRASGSAIRSVHRLELARAEELAAEAEAALRTAQSATVDEPAVAHAGFLHDAEKEYAEARLTLAFVTDAPLPSAADIDVFRTSWLRGLAEAASELRRHALDRLADGDLDRARELVTIMDDVYDVLMTVDYPDALTGGLRRTVDALRGVLERTRSDLTTTVLQERLRRALEDG